MEFESTWSLFLHARQLLINEWRTEGKDCTTIARELSMDPGQVYLISQVESGDPPEDARRSILEVQQRSLRMLDMLVEASKKDKGTK